MRSSRLPPMVAPLADAPVRLNSSPSAMKALAADIGSVPVQALLPVMAVIFGNGLMYANPIVELSISISSRFRKISRSEAWALGYINVGQRMGAQKLADLLIEKQTQIVRHILNGKDREDDNSIGGMSKREAQALSNVLAVARRSPSPDILSIYERAARNQLRGAQLS